MYVLQVFWRGLGTAAPVQAHWNHRSNSTAVDVQVRSRYETIYERDIENPNWIRRKKSSLVSYIFVFNLIQESKWECASEVAVSHERLQTLLTTNI
jgi:hypothetical protein